MRKNIINLRILLIMLLSIVMIKTNAQTGLNFQGVARTTNNVILASQAITIKLSILQGSSTGTADYTETRKVTTNAQGLFTAVIGDTGAISTLGNFTTINWKLSPKFLKIEMDAAAGTNFITMGTTQFQYVAYAQFAKSVDAENIVGIVPVTLGGTGVSNIAGLKAALTLNNVNNTSDADKIISTKTQAALDLILVTATDTTRLSKRINAKADTTDLKGGLDLKLNAADSIKYTKQTYSDSALLTKLKISDTAVMISSRIARDTLNLSNRINLKSNTTDVTTSLSLKENLLNKSTAVDLGGISPSDILFPTQKAVKDYVTANNSGGGVADGGITTIKLADLAVTDAKINTVSGSKVIGSITGNAATATLATNATTAGNITATTNTTLTSLSNLVTLGTITSGVWSGTTVAIEKGGTGLTAAGTAGQILTSTGSGTLTWTSTGKLLSIGDVYQGGKVAYILQVGDPGYDATIQKGLIAATSDQSTGIRWYNGSYTSTGATGTAIGTGLSNTNTIIASQGATATSYAAGLARAHNGGGYTDWYLPSKDELNKLYTNKTAIGGFASNGYWSSTELDANDAWEQDFLFGNKFNFVKYYPFYVRAIRAFSSVKSIEDGGTGATTQQTAVNALTGSQISGTYLRSDGTNSALSTIQVADVPTLNQNTSGNAATATTATKLATARTINGVVFDGTADINITASADAGTLTGTILNSTVTSSSLTSVGTIISGTWSGTAVAVKNGGTGLISAGTNGQVLTSTGSGTLTWTGTHYIGESYCGGIVFYVYDNGKHGLIAAITDQSTGIRWYGGSYTNTRARGDGVGAGLKNTAIIIANQGAVDGSAFAATVCNEYSVAETVGGITTAYGDWYLPSKLELNLLYLQRTVVGGFENGGYWSSTEDDGNYAWDQHFYDGGQFNLGKSNNDFVRAIRTF